LRLQAGTPQLFDKDAAGAVNDERLLAADQDSATELFLMAGPMMEQRSGRSISSTRDGDRSGPRLVVRFLDTNRGQEATPLVVERRALCFNRMDR